MRNDGVRTARSLARRADMFTGKVGELNVQYPSGRAEGVVRLLAQQGLVLDGTALLLLSAFQELYMQQFQTDAGYNQWLSASARQIGLLSLGGDGGNVYRRLGLTRRPGDPGAIEALEAVLIRRQSQFLADGERQYAQHDFHLVEESYFQTREGDEDGGTLAVRLGEPVQVWLQRGDVLLLPAGVRRLGAKDDAALRLWHFVASHAPLPTKRRRSGKARRGEVVVISAMAVAPVLGWAPSMLLPRRRSQYLKRLHALVRKLDRADPSRTWRLVAATARSWDRKIVVRPTRHRHEAVTRE